MLASVILGIGQSSRIVDPFRQATGAVNIDWRFELPSRADLADAVLVFGGDGTVHRHLDSLVRLGLPVLIVPAGSGNDFARGLGLRRIHDSLRAWTRFCQRNDNVGRVDLGVIRPLADASAAETGKIAAGGSGKFFCTVAGAGLDAEVARRAAKLPRWLRRRGGYIFSLAASLLRFAPARPVLIAASCGWTWRGHRPITLVACANTSTYGGGMKIAPHASVNDGLLDICVIGSMHPLRLAWLFPRVYFGSHTNLPQVECLQATRLRVESETPQAVYADGEYVSTTPVEISLQPAALKIILP